MNNQALLVGNDTSDDPAEYLKAIEKALQVLQEDTQVNYDTLLSEQLKEFYLLQPEQATLSDNFYFIEKQQQAPDEV